MRLDKERFQQLVEDAIRNVPKKYFRRIQNVAILVEDFPPPGQNLLGLYHGVPLKNRGSYYGNVPPDVIVLYKEPIESLCQSEEEIRERIEEVLLHEIGHYFGLEEKELREIEAWRIKRARKIEREEN